MDFPKRCLTIAKKARNFLSLFDPVGHNFEHKQKIDGNGFVIIFWRAFEPFIAVFIYDQ